MEISKEVYAAIEKQLTSEAAGIIKGILAQAEADSKEVVMLKEENIRLKEVEVKLRRDLAECKVLESEIQANKDRIKDIEVRERNLKIETLVYQLECEKNKTDFCKEVALGLVKNVEYKRSQYTSMQKTFPDNNGNYKTANESYNTVENSSY